MYTVNVLKFRTLFILTKMMLVFGTGIYKALVRITNREDPDQTASSKTDCFLRSSLIWVCTVYLGHIGRQLVFKILEYVFIITV